MFTDVASNGFAMASNGFAMTLIDSKWMHQAVVRRHSHLVL
jgi:hypothetical protein